MTLKAFMSLIFQALMKDASCIALECDVYVNSAVNFGEFPGGEVGRQSINQHDVDTYKEKRHPLCSLYPQVCPVSS